MASINPFIRLNSFDPDMTRAMTAALASAWEQLSVAGHVTAMPYKAANTRERMARAILDLAQRGVDDPQRLVAVALSAALSAKVSVPVPSITETRLSAS